MGAGDPLRLFAGATWNKSDNDLMFPAAADRLRGGQEHDAAGRTGRRAARVPLRRQELACAAGAQGTVGRAWVRPALFNACAPMSWDEPAVRPRPARGFDAPETTRGRPIRRPGRAPRSHPTRSVRRDQGTIRLARGVPGGGRSGADRSRFPGGRRTTRVCAIRCW